MLRTIRARLIVTSLLAGGVPLVALGVFLANALWRFYLEQLDSEITAHATIIADAAAPHLQSASATDRQALAVMLRRWKVFSQVRVTIADAKYVVCASTTDSDVGELVTEQGRPGLRQALHGFRNSAIYRNPHQGNEDTQYVNIPVRAQGKIIGAVRVAYTLTQIQQNLTRIRETLLMGVTVFAVLIVVLTIRLAGSIVKPVEDLNRGAQQIAGGDWTRRLPVNGAREIANLAESLNQMTRRLEQLESNRQQFVSNVSHELRTPLTAIRSMADTLIEHGETDPTLAERYLPRITEQTDRLARLTSQLLDLAEIESGNVVASPQPLALSEIVDDALRTSANAAHSKGVHVVVNLPSRRSGLHGDRDRLVQVFINLLDNAIRHTPTGGAVTVAASEQGGQLIVTVTDTGEGIAVEHLPRLFERFYRVDKARSRRLGGTGLGLSVVDQIVKAHGGQMEVTSEVGRGTRFTVRLPLA